MDTMSFYIFYKEKAQKETMIYLHKKQPIGRSPIFQPAVVIHIKILLSLVFSGTAVRL